MKLNYQKISTEYMTVIAGITYRYGWYYSGRAFIAKEEELMTYRDAYVVFVPKCCYNMHNCFFVGLSQYDKSLDGIVRYLIDKYSM